MKEWIEGVVILLIIASAGVIATYLLGELIGWLADRYEWYDYKFHGRFIG